MFLDVHENKTLIDVCEKKIFICVKSLLLEEVKEYLCALFPTEEEDISRKSTAWQVGSGRNGGKKGHMAAERGSV